VVQVEKLIDCEGVIQVVLWCYSSEFDLN